MIQTAQKMNLIRKGSGAYGAILGVILLSGIYGGMSSLITFYVAYHNAAPTVFDLYYGFGELVDSLYHTNVYQSADGFWTAHRMPFIPYFLTAVSILSTDTAHATIIKNVLFFPLTGCAIYITWKKTFSLPTWSFVGFLLYLSLFPHFILYSTMVDVEEGYLIHFFALLFVNLFFYDGLALRLRPWFIWLTALLITLLFLTKSSMLLTSITFAVAFYFRSGKDRRLLLYCLAVVLSGLFLWGAMNWLHSGKLTISSSWDGWNLYKGNNEQVAVLYPSHNLDALDHTGWIPPAAALYPNEWEANQAYLKQALAFVISQPIQTLHLFSTKLYVFFLEIRKVPLYPQQVYIGSISSAGLLIFRIFFFVTIVLGLKALVNKHPWTEQQCAALRVNIISYFTIVIVYATPYLVGFAYTRHIVPLIIPTCLCLIYILAYGQTPEQTRGGLSGTGVLNQS